MKFFYIFFMTIFIMIFLWLTLIFFQLGKPTLMSQWVYDSYQKKIAIANKINSQKVVIVAGSNSLFGIDSKKISKYFNLPIVNFSVNAGVLIPYVLHNSKRVLKPNDIVILPLEYSMYVYDGDANAQMIDYIFAREPSFLKELFFKELFNVLFKVSLQRVMEGYKKYDDKPITEGLYGSHNIDNYGDQINTTTKDRSDNFFNEAKGYKPETYGRDYNQNALFWKILNNFVKWAKKRDIKLIFIPATIMYKKEYKENKKEREFYTNLPIIMKNKGYLFLGEPYHFMYNEEYFFNTNFHLTDEGRAINTQKIIELLKVNVVFKK